MMLKAPSYTAGQVAAAAPQSSLSERAYDLFFSDYTANGGTVVLTKTGTVVLAAVLVAGLAFAVWRA